MTHETLDPDDWEAFRTLGHRMLDDMLDHLVSLDERPAWQAMPDHVSASFDEPLPLDPEGAEAAYRAFRDRVLPFSNGNLHPRFWGWVQGNGTPLGMMADMLASGLNPHMAGFNQAPAAVEHQVLRWLTELVGLPPVATGVLTGGGTMANILGLAVARNTGVGYDVRRLGVNPAGHRGAVVYTSSETHSWIEKGVELLGLGSESLRRIPVDPAYRIDVARLTRAITDDRAAGLRPMCIVGSAGTVNTGAIDDLPALADLARKEKLWFHVDGAFGALARLSPSLAPLVEGIERADSVALDLHKWIYLPFEVGAVLVRDAEAHRNTFAVTPAYLAQEARGVAAGGMPFADRGVELTRSFRALKVWMSFKAHGLNQFSRLIEQNVDHARRLAALMAADPAFELLAPVSLNIVCFRLVPAGVDHARLNELNRELLLRIQESGLAVPSGTELAGRFALRVAITNHRSRWEDFVAFLDGTKQIGARLLEESR
jgi:glutamate/tyrosine decarboxylase-like PLP-dependent enzyme